MTGADQRQATFCATLVDEWIAKGLEHVVICPGSRSTPMVLALAARPELSCHVRLDERSAAFVALGIARATRRPVGVLVTSGTAAAELFAAVCEANHAFVPLLLLTADRPPELQGVGAPQAMDQVGLYGSHVREAWSIDPRDLESGEWRGLAAETYAATLGAAPGPVQLNLMLADPLVGEAGSLPPRSNEHASVAPEQANLDHRAVEALSGRRVLVVAGEADYEPEQLAQLAERLGWPVVADPRSGLRGAGGSVICAADLIARELPEHLVPEAVLRIGGLPASKAVGQLITQVSRQGAPVVLLDHVDRPSDPDHAVTLGQPGSLRDLIGSLEGVADPAPPGWAEGWAVAESALQAALDLALAGSCTEPAVARAISGLAGVELVVSSSMPVRDLEAFGRSAPGQGRVHANRGLNGIDGVTSTAIGVALGSRRPTVLLTGDLAFLHDATALVDGVGEASLDVVVTDNDGGAIFSFLPQHEALAPEAFERFFGTPPRVGVAALARACGHEVVEPAGPDELLAGLEKVLGRPGLRVWRVVVPHREDNLELHRRLAAMARETR